MLFFSTDFFNTTRISMWWSSDDTDIPSKPSVMADNQGNMHGNWSISVTPARLHWTAPCPRTASPSPYHQRHRKRSPVKSAGIFAKYPKAPCQSTPLWRAFSEKSEFMKKCLILAEKCSKQNPYGEVIRTMPYHERSLTMIYSNEVTGNVLRKTGRAQARAAP